MSTNLPFPIDSAYDYILDEADRKKFAPVQQGDEFWHHTLGKWAATVRVDEPSFTPSYLYRRRKSSGWVSVDTAKPELTAPILASDGHALFAYKDGIKDYDLFLGWQLTHWMPWNLPALPQPPRPAEEVAFEKWWVSDDGYSISFPSHVGKCRDAFLAGSEWAKANKEKL